MQSVYTVAIEGFEYILTNGNTAAVATAYAANPDWTTAIGGLFVELNNSQSFNPWAPLGGGGTCAIRVLPDANDYLGIQIGRTAGGWQTELTSTASRTDATIYVTDTTNAAASGTFWIGNECIAYTGKTATSFTGCTRGKYSPFASGVFDTNRWADRHRIVTTAQFSATNRTTVSQYRRTWKGAWVAVREHVVTAGVVDPLAGSQVVFAGQIADVVDDPSTGCAVIQLKHVLDIVRETTLLRDQYRARIHRGVYMYRDETITAFDRDSVGAAVGMLPLTVMQSGAAGAYQINEGMYTAEEIVDKINLFLATEYAAGHLKGQHVLTVTGVLGDQKIRHAHTFPASSGSNYSYLFTTPERLAKFLGGPSSPPGSVTVPVYSYASSGSTAATDFLPGSIPAVAISETIKQTIPVTDESGAFFDNSDYLPASFAQYDDGTNAVGLFLLDGKQIVAGRISAGSLVDARLVVESTFSITSPPSQQWASGVEIVQIAVVGVKRSTLMKDLFLSTGDAGYNDATYDPLAYGLGLNIPATLLGTTFKTSCDAVVGADSDAAMWLTKPMKLIDVIEGDLILSGMHLIFRNGVMSFDQWKTPDATHATVALTEANKASPAGTDMQERSSTLLDSSWARPIVKIEFDYDPIADKFAQPLTLEDADAVDSIGGSTVTIHARNFGQGQSAADAMTAAIPEFFARWLPMMSRPIIRITRSIDPRFYEGHAPGEIAIVTDAFARDPATGLRGVSARPGMVLSHRYNPGGEVPGGGGRSSVTPPQGEVELLVLADNRGTIWSPAAEVDETMSTGGYSAGYNSGTLALRVYDSKHSEAAEPVDAANFATGDKIRIVEVDPVGAPDTWSRTVASVSGSDIILTAALAAPAWSATKRYRITSDVYTTAVGLQQADAYQADDADGLIQGSPAYLYGLAGPGIAFTSMAHTELAELEVPASIASSGDGVAYDTGYHRAIAATINNFMDHKSAQQGSALTTSALVYASAGAPDWVLVETKKRFFGVGSLGIVRRLLAVAPWLRSTAGTSSVRVTLSATRPRRKASATGEYDDVVFSAPYSQATFTSSSATWATATEDYLDLRYLDAQGCCYISIECKATAQTRGLALCIVRERT